MVPHCPIRSSLSIAVNADNVTIFNRTNRKIVLETNRAAIGLPPTVDCHAIVSFTKDNRSTEKVSQPCRSQSMALEAGNLDLANFWTRGQCKCVSVVLTSTLSNSASPQFFCEQPPPRAPANASTHTASLCSLHPERTDGRGTSLSDGSSTPSRYCYYRLRHSDVTPTTT